MTPRAPTATLWLLAACSGGDGGSKGTTPDTVVASVSLEMADDGGTGALSAPYPLDVPAGTGCVSTVELVSHNLGVIMVPTLPFLDPAPGVGSIMWPNWKMYWSRSDPEAQGSAPMTDSWAGGTWIIREWSADRPRADAPPWTEC